MGGIALEGVSKVFPGGVVAVDDVDLEIGDGETSASAVPLRCLERLDLLDCVDQVHRDIWLHTRRRSQRMRFFDFATRTSSHLAPPPLGKIPTITVSPDGGRLLFDTDANPASNLTLMQLSRSAG